MTRISYKRLMKNVKDGRMEVYAWSGEYAQVIVWPSDLSKAPKRKMYEVTDIPADFQR